MDKKKYIDVLTQHADMYKRPYEMALNDFLDFLLSFFSVDAFRGDSTAYQQHIIRHVKNDPDFVDLVFVWLADVAKEMDCGRWLDAFGEIYEDMYLSRGKASAKGQFFTPRSVSDLCAQIINQGKDSGTVNDCAAGSGRLLLSHFIDATKNDHSAAHRFRYLAQDSDPIACKMCALNMMAHGMNAKVVCQDTLAMSSPTALYYINEVRFPLSTPYYSVRMVAPENGIL